MHIGEGELRPSRVPERNLCKARLPDLQTDEYSYEAQLERLPRGRKDRPWTVVPYSVVAVLVKHDALPQNFTALTWSPKRSPYPLSCSMPYRLSPTGGFYLLAWAPTGHRGFLKCSHEALGAFSGLTDLPAIWVTLCLECLGLRYLESLLFVVCPRSNSCFLHIFFESSYRSFESS